MAVVQLLQQALALVLGRADALEQRVLVGGNGVELRGRGCRAGQGNAKVDRLPTVVVVDGPSYGLN